MPQPDWSLIMATDFYAVFVDRTGVYPPEMVYGDEADDGTFTVYRFPLDRMKVVQSEGAPYLVPFAYAEDWPYPASMYREWFDDSLSSVAESVGRSKDSIVSDLTSEDPIVRSGAYLDIGSYHGFANLDAYPVNMSEEAFAAILDGKGGAQ